MSEESANGHRYVTHQRLSDVLDQHRREEAAVAQRLAADTSGRVTVAEHQRLVTQVERIESTVGQHDDVLQQQRGARSMLYAIFGSSVLGLVVALAALLR